jgi:hypothetical protein
MNKFIGVVALLVLTGFMAMPTLAAELQVRGFFENVLPHVDHNTSDADLDMTRATDQIFFGRERTRLYFDFLANDDLRGVFALEVDSVSMARPVLTVSDPAVRRGPISIPSSSAAFATASTPTTSRSRTYTSISGSLNFPSEIVGSSVASPRTSPLCIRTCSTPSTPAAGV